MTPTATAWLLVVWATATTKLFAVPMLPTEAECMRLSSIMGGYYTCTQYTTIAPGCGSPGNPCMLAK